MFSAPTITLPLCFVSEVIQIEKGNIFRVSMMKNQ